MARPSGLPVGQRLHHRGPDEPRRHRRKASAVLSSALAGPRLKRLAGAGGGVGGVGPSGPPRVASIPGLRDDGLLFESATGLLRRLLRRELSASELLEATWLQVHRFNPTLKAIVTPREDESRIEAREADAALAKGKAVGPLHGLPFTVKDLIATAGLRTTAGSIVLRDHVPRVSATAISRLQAAGAILLGKSNCAEFGLDLHTANRVFGETWNPCSTRHTSGGSSGGDSAAVAAGMAAFGIGTDYGGSIRWPAHCTGTASLRPTPGVVPGTGQLPLSGPGDLPPPNSSSIQVWLQTIAPLARSAGDLALLTRTMAGPDGLDAHAVPVELGDPATIDIRDLPCAWCDGDGTVPVRADVRAAVAAAGAALERRGVRVINERPTALDRAEEAYGALRAAEGLPDHAALVSDHEAELTDYFRTWLAAPLATAALGEFRALTARADTIRAQVMAFMERWPMLLLPVASIPAFQPGPWDFVVEGVEVPRFNIVTCCRVVTLLRAPAAVVICGTSSEGLPIGVQVVGRPYHDHEVLAVAAALEHEFGRWTPRGVVLQGGTSRLASGGSLIDEV
jgi:Asp-tRNA(Asn)/Glu-tRNA(Gln) amidotransferase A subunit family amidase